MLFQSKYSLYQVFCRGGWKKYHEVTGVEIGEVKPLIADFGQYAGEFQFQNHLTGGMDTGADIRGHFFDSDAAAERNNWTPEEKESVEMAVLEQCRLTPLTVWVVTHEEQGPPAVEKPWTTYDKTSSELIPEYAAELQCIDQAILYEQANKNRKGVLAALEEKLAAVAQTAELTAT